MLQHVDLTVEKSCQLSYTSHIIYQYFAYFAVGDILTLPSLSTDKAHFSTGLVIEEPFHHFPI